MHIEIETIATIAKGVSIKREKGSDDMEVVVAHLKFDGAFVPREVIDELCGQPIGWSAGFLFDEFGQPRARLEINLPKFEAEATGTIRGVKDGDSITLRQAVIDGVLLALYDKGAMLSGSLAWKVAGDEVSDLEPLLGRLCAMHIVVQDSGQGDMLQQARDSITRMGGGKLSLTDGDGKETVLVDIPADGDKPKRGRAGKDAAAEQGAKH